ncbi:ABC transporter ATP-binding protein [Nostoc sp. NMS4]|uniref:ATP-binding cassette domain-containing protein n=1 Tax=Nostoc sp. NMS4 TaxID=2815390 RepID=UPI0025FACCAA|nr:ABC transporter ATP-binding protein [Nostoc sp. NMS4]MBN3928022.1 ABC transporter ATP-binding protein [Nostoc sp. NMS4]
MSLMEINEEVLLELINVEFHYPGNSNSLLKNVNFSIKPGEKKGIIGDNGSGKSTIAKLFLGLYSPQNGTVNLFGKKVKWGHHYPQLGYIGDPAYKPGQLGLPIGISVKEVVELFQETWLFSTTKSNLVNFKSQLKYLQNQLNIADFNDRDVSDLSKGQRMKLMAFLALGKNPLLLIADEATEGLDADSLKTVISAVMQASKHQKIGMLWISHRRYEVAMLTDKIYQLSEGKLSETCLEKFRLSVQTEPDIDIFSGKNFIDLLTSKDVCFDLMGHLFTESSVSKFRLEGIREE